MPSNPQLSGRLGGLKSWSKTVDRSARTAKSRKAGPGELDYHLARLDPELFANATDEQRQAAADAARRAYFAELAFKSAQARAERAKERRRGRGAR